MNYSALTIGPIHKTLHISKSTKAIWTASYMFSFLMKKIITKIREENNGVKFILPYSELVFINGKEIYPLDSDFRIHTGLFPDRLIVKGNVGFKKIIDDVLTNFSVESGISMEYLRDYLNFYHLVAEFNDSDNVIEKINELLDSLELQQKVLTKSDDNSLVDFLDKKNPYNFLIKSEFQKRPFPSTVEISTAEFEDNYIDNEAFKEALKKLKLNDDENQIQFIKDVKVIVGDSFRNYQKYIAVVQADGDNMGSFIGYLYNQPNKDELIKQFSKNLLAFSIESVELIKSYKGTPIYAGGDDLLYFMPVAQISLRDNQVVINKTIFSLISEIDDLFNKYFTSFNKEGVDFESIIKNTDKKPSMSYGVSISYYKFPLNEALEEGVNQLFSIAKKTGKKDAVSYAVLKHSGQYFGTTFHKKSSSYKTFLKLISENPDKSDFITSIIHKLEPQKSVIQAIGVNHKNEREKLFDNFLLNNFNESIHRQKTDRNKLTPFLEKTKQLLIDTYNENELLVSLPDIEKQNDLNLKMVYSSLRFIEFIHNKEERDE